MPISESRYYAKVLSDWLLDLAQDMHDRIGCDASDVRYGVRDHLINKLQEALDTNEIACVVYPLCDAPPDYVQEVVHDLLDETIAELSSFRVYDDTPDRTGGCS